MGLSLELYLSWAKDQTIPPFCLEIVMRSGRSYWVKNVFDHADTSGLFAIRIWDFRTIPDADLPGVLAKFNQLGRRDPIKLSDIHLQLDQANLWIRLEDVDHLVEWHDRVWPEPVTEGTERPKIGFAS